MLNSKKLFTLRLNLIAAFEKEYRKHPIYIVEDGVRKINRVENIDSLVHKVGVINSFLNEIPMGLMEAQPGTKVRARKQRQNHSSFMVATVPGIDYLKEGDIYTISGVYVADCFYVLQFEEFPGLTFMPEDLELLEEIRVTEDNIRELYGEDFDADLNGNGGLLRKMRLRSNHRKSPEYEMFLLNDDLSLTELECDRKKRSRR